MRSFSELAVPALALAIAIAACRSPLPPRVATTPRIDSGTPVEAQAAAAVAGSTCSAAIDRERVEASADDAAKGGTKPEIVTIAVDAGAEFRLVVPTATGVVAHALGSYGNPECDDSFSPSLVAGPIIHVSWRQKRSHFMSMSSATEEPCDEIGVGDCTLGCKDEGATEEHLFFEASGGARVLTIAIEHGPGDADAPPEVTLDDGVVRVKGGGCDETIPLR